MAEWPRTNRVFIDDVRGDGKFLRATWHPAERVFVISTWDGNVCVGATRLAASGGAELIRLLADGLAGAAESPPAPALAAPRMTGWRAAQRRVRAWLHRLTTRPAPPIKWPDHDDIEERRSA